MLRQLNSEASRLFIDAVMGVIVGEDPELVRDTETPDRQNAINWAIAQLLALISQPAISQLVGWQVSILRFAAIHGLFTVTKDLKDIGEVSLS